ncbi:MAG: ATP-binding cassette domain-containing protein [Bacteroidales bacterium]|nr:ATP-binding cassette domain-containing protein [Bacteroidales bacterium]
MSEKILKALMQLFAIIARPESNRSDRRSVVESFLKRELNQELVDEYLRIFDHYYKLHQEKQKVKEKRVHRISSSSVRVLKICTEINEELTQQQKIIVLFQLLEFARSDGETVTEQEMAFINTVADTFNFPESEFDEMAEFILNPIETLPDSPNILIVSGKVHRPGQEIKYIHRPGTNGEISIYHINTGNVFLIKYLGESELYMNSQLLHQDRIYVFNTGSSLRDRKGKPVYYSDVLSRFQEDRIKEKLYYQVRNIEYRFKGGKIGIHEMSFEAESGKLFGIMGASGAGKSTLLNVLNGTNSPTKGEVLINGVNIHAEKEKIEGLIGFVSQDDLLIEELTVYQNLYFNAKLCFGNYTEEQLNEAVNNVLNSLGLLEIKDLLVGSPLNKKISGGQRKRLNIALELIREPPILFLDEPTSGLSSRDSENIMDLLKELALKGKLVFVVIHQPSSDIFKMFDNLLILDNGGYLIFNGNPVDSLTHFKKEMHYANWNESECHVCGNVNVEQVFNIIETQVLDEYGKVTGTRKLSPSEWNKIFKENFPDTEPKEIKTGNIPPINFKIPRKVIQWMVFTKRDILSKLSNTQYLVINFLEAPVLAFFLAFLIKYYDETGTTGYTLINNDNLPVYLFMAVIIAIFMGLTVSAEEIIKDRKILKREAFLNLSWSSYLLSKVAVQFGISAVQAFTFVLVGNAIMEIHGMFWQYWLVLFATWASSNLMGLVISDSFKTVVTIYILIPFLVIPQIVLSGVLVKYEKLNPAISSPAKIPFYGEAFSARWAYEALAVYQYMENKYEKHFYPLDKMMSIADFKKIYWYNELKSRLDQVERNYNKPEKKNQVLSDLTILTNEIGKELQKNPRIPFGEYQRLVHKDITPELLRKIRLYLETVKNYYKKYYNLASNKKDQIISDMVNKDKEGFIKLKEQYLNDRLKEFVTNKNGKNRIVIYKGQIIQKMDPIYLDPPYKFVKAQFYAPRKKFFGSFVPTFWVNIIVIWGMAFMFYLILQYRLFKRFLDQMEHWSSRLFPEEE